MSTQASTARRIADIKGELLEAFRGFRIDEAELLYQELIDGCGVDPDSDEALPFRVSLGIFRGRLRDMLCMLNNLGEDRAPVLKAVCLRWMGDPFWEGTALAHESSQDQAVRVSMQTLLQAAA